MLESHVDSGGGTAGVVGVAGVPGVVGGVADGGGGGGGGGVDHGGVTTGAMLLAIVMPQVEVTVPPEVAAGQYLMILRHTFASNLCEAASTSP